MLVTSTMSTVSHWWMRSREDRIYINRFQKSFLYTRANYTCGLPLEKLFWSNCRKKNSSKILPGAYILIPRRLLYSGALSWYRWANQRFVRRELENPQNLLNLEVSLGKIIPSTTRSISCNILPTSRWFFGKSFWCYGQARGIFPWKNTIPLSSSSVVASGIWLVNQPIISSNILVIGEIDKDNFNLFLTKHFFRS